LNCLFQGTPPLHYVGPGTSLKNPGEKIKTEANWNRKGGGTKKKEQNTDIKNGNHRQENANIKEVHGENALMFLDPIQG